MSRKDLFILGSKWIGVYCLALAIGELFKAFPLTFTYVPRLRQSVPLFTLSNWLSFIGPVGYLTIGTYLISGGSYIRDFWFHGDDENSTKNSKDFFDVGIKLYGLYLIAVSIPGCIWLVANALIALSAPPYLSIEDELEGLRSYLPSVLASLGLGMCCLVWSGRVAGLAFRRTETGVP